MPELLARWKSIGFWLSVCLILPWLVFGGTTGKIAGVVKDKQTGEFLPAVNIQLQNTTLGAATDIQGRYFVLSVPPGSYALMARMMGYQTVTVKDVKVGIDQTTHIDFTMQQVVLELGDAVEIIAQRPVIQKDLTSSVAMVDLEKINQSTATTVNDAVNLQIGVFFDPVAVEGNLSGTGRGEARYSIRGGEQDEIVFYIDGTRSSSMSESRADAGAALTQINPAAIKEIQIFTGGFNSEYGQAQSGIVNLVTKDGSPSYTFSMDYLYGPPQQRHFGNYLYDHEKNVEFRNHTLVDGTLDPTWWTPTRQSQVYDYRQFADHDVKFTFGGPFPGALLPLIGSELKKMSFFLTGNYQQKAYELPRPRDTRQITNLNLSGSYNIRPGLSLKFGGMYNDDAHATNNEESFPYFAKYYRGYGTLLDNYIYQTRLNLIHTLSTRSFYEIKISSYTLKQNETPSPYRVPGESLQPDIWGWHRYDGFEAEPFIAHLFTPINHNVTQDFAVVANFNLQVNHIHFLKTGLDFHYNTYKEDSWVLSEFSDDLKYWRLRGLNETYHPLQLGLYLQDKMEFESMIFNFGVRFDYFNGNRKWFTKDDYILNPGLDPAYRSGADLDKDGVDSLGHKKWDFNNVLAKSRSQVKPNYTLNPRLGLSFPITDNTNFHFSYGHFYQMPAINTQFELAYFRPLPIIKGAPSTDSDPERVINMTLESLKPEKTIQFEMGFKHHFRDLALFTLTGFYKDVFDQVERPAFLDRRIYGIDPYTGNESRIFYSSRYSGDYGDARGLELTLRSLFSQNLVLDLNYSFSKSKSGRATPWQIHIDKNGAVTYQWYSEAFQRLPVEKSFSRPHILRVNLFLQYPETWRLPVLNPLFRGSDLSLLYQYVSGQAFTYLEADDPPDLLDNHRFPAKQTWDLKFNRYFELGAHTFTFYTKISNLFNQKNIRAWGNAFDVDALDRFVKTGQPTFTDPDGYDLSYMIYFAPRCISVGFRYNFR